MSTQQQRLLNVLLIGDSCEDIYHYGTCDRISPEAAVPGLKQSSVLIKKGMSSNVRLNLEAFRIFVTHHTNNEQIKKHRFIDTRYNQHLFRWDEGECEKLESFNIDFVTNVHSPIPDAVVISDYNKGFLNFQVCKGICQHFKEIGVPVFVDTKKKDLTCFEDCVIKINEKEYDNIEVFPKRSEFVVTIGENGTRYNDQIFPTEPVEVFDVCGAGDVFMASLVYGYLMSENISKSIPLANKMASLSVCHMGTYVITKEDIRQNGICI